MDVFSSMIHLLSEKAVSIGVDKLIKSAEFKHTQFIMRERLLREIKFNSEINRLPKITVDQAIDNYETKILYGLIEQPFVLQSIFPKPLDQDLPDQINKRFMNRAVRIWISLHDNEAELIEKLITRLKTHKLRKSLAINAGAKVYVMALVEALYLSLQREQ
jgi:hypothetical protein